MPFSTQTAPSSCSRQPRRASLRPAAHAGLHRLTLFVCSLVMLSCVALLVPRIQAQQKKAQAPSQYFTGEVEYKVSASGSNEDGLAAFKSFAPTMIKIIYGREGFRIIETGGMENNVLLNYGRGAAYLLDAGAKTATKVSVMNLDDEDGAKLASIMPYHYRTDMQPTGKTEKVAGHACREYKVLKSAFIRNGATASICVAEAVRFKPSRYSFQNESRRADSPLPLSLPVPEGAILKMEVNESGVSAVYEAVKITPGAPAAAAFSVPAGYKIKSDK